LFHKFVCFQMQLVDRYASALLLAVTAVLLAMIVVRGAKFELGLQNNLARRRGSKGGNKGGGKSAAAARSVKEGSSGDESVAMPSDRGAAAAPAAAPAPAVVEHRREMFELTGLDANPTFTDDDSALFSTSVGAGPTNFSIKLVSSNGISPAKLETLLRAHVSVQADRLGEQIQAEIAAQKSLLKEKENKNYAVVEAVSVVFTRTLEAYFSWKVWRSRSKTLNMVGLCKLSSVC
jgi:hypothetical protein